MYQCKVGIPTVVYYLVNGSHFFLASILLRLPQDVYPNHSFREVSGR